MPILVIVPIFFISLVIALSSIELLVSNKQMFVCFLPLIITVSIFFMYVYTYSNVQPDEVIERKVHVHEGVATIFPELINMNNKLNANFIDGDIVYEEKYHSKMYYGFYSMAISQFKKEKNESK